MEIYEVRPVPFRLTPRRQARLGGLMCKLPTHAKCVKTDIYRGFGGGGGGSGGVGFWERSAPIAKLYACSFVWVFSCARHLRRIKSTAMAGVSVAFFKPAFGLFLLHTATSDQEANLTVMRSGTYL